jgi:hypothetical protein
VIRATGKGWHRRLLHLVVESVEQAWAMQLRAKDSQATEKVVEVAA